MKIFLEPTTVHSVEGSCTIPVDPARGGPAIAIADKAALFGDFIDTWHISPVLPLPRPLDDLTCPIDTEQLQPCRHTWPGALCNAPAVSAHLPDTPRLAWYVQRFASAEAMDLELQLGYNVPIKGWIDGQPVWHDMDQSKQLARSRPVPHAAAGVPWPADAGIHEFMIALEITAKQQGGLFARFCRNDAPRLDGDTRMETHHFLPVVHKQETP